MFFKNYLSHCQSMSNVYLMMIFFFFSHRLFVVLLACCPFEVGPDKLLASN
jgi:hypothetical protein